jgi:hypothetical protein
MHRAIRSSLPGDSRRFAPICEENKRFYRDAEFFAQEAVIILICGHHGDYPRVTSKPEVAGLGKSTIRSKCAELAVFFGVGTKRIKGSLLRSFCTRGTRCAQYLS